MARTDTLGHFLTDVADAIRSKLGSSATILAKDFDTQIRNISGGGGSGYYNVRVDTSKSYSSYSSGGIKSLITEIGDIDTSNMTNMAYMFNNCIALASEPILNTNNVTNMDSMFLSCAKLKNISQLDISTVTNTKSMFMSCSSLESVIFNNSGICSPTNTQSMFSNCIKLTHIDIRDFDFSNVTSYTNMFGTPPNGGVPDDCEIIVADDTQKTWITTNFSRLTNVKTVAEYEAEQGE